MQMTSTTEPTLDTATENDGAQLSLIPEAPPLPPLTEQTQQPTIWQFKFHGDAEAYFKIWIVNVLLTAITLGFYAPWAKVRNFRYFFGNTEVNERRFDFVASPKRILIGRLIALAIWAALFISAQLESSISLIGAALIFIATPWMIRSSLRFMARNSKYSNNRFAFTASLGTTYKMAIACFFAYILGIMTLGLLLPVIWWVFKRFQWNHMEFAGLKMHFNATLGQVYKATILPVLGLLALFVLAIVGVFASTDATTADITYELTVALTMAFALFYLGMLLVTPYIMARLFQVSWSNMKLGNNEFRTTLKPMRYMLIFVTNAIAIAFTFGLLTPWAKIRMLNYQLSTLSLVVRDFPETLEKTADSDESPLGEELADVFDIDISW